MIGQSLAVFDKVRWEKASDWFLGETAKPLEVSNMMTLTENAKPSGTF